MRSFIYEVSKIVFFLCVCDAHLEKVAYCLECHMVLRHLEKELIGKGT